MVLTNGLSRMRGDPHVRFLGGGGAVMRRCYPTLGVFCNLQVGYGSRSPTLKMRFLSIRARSTFAARFSLPQTARSAF
jgi:hypothetical protein